MVATGTRTGNRKFPPAEVPVEARPTDPTLRTTFVSWLAVVPVPPVPVEEGSADPGALPVGGSSLL